MSTQLDRIEAMIRALDRKVDRIASIAAANLTGDEILMALSQNITDLLSKIDAATTAIANRLAALANAHPDDVELAAALQKEVDILTGLGADPANPVPVVPPVSP